MHKQNDLERLQEQWQRATEQASENVAQATDLGAAKLKQVSSMRLRTRLRVGDWSDEQNLFTDKRQCPF